MTARVAVLVSGGGSNLQALLDATADPWFGADIVKVVSNVSGVVALDRAAQSGVATEVLDHRGRPRAEFEADLLRAVGDVEFVCLAGFMRVLTGAFLARFSGRVLNIHPGLLPLFPGLHAPRQALAAGVTQAGATVHLVDAGVDTGPILAQGTVPVLQGDTEATLAARILTMEHRLYPMALRWMAEGRVVVEGGRATVELRPGESRWLSGG
ncbi:MAG: phosphoribosylglycinamide formyltransferase [Myxococcales bacterium]|nr:phosphoribosylglycinamide formyltransferase [Myxococcales bacterium]